MRDLPPTTITVLYDAHEAGGLGRYYVTATINSRDHEVGHYATATEAGAAMVKWLNDRGLTTALGSGRRVSEAQRFGSSPVVTLDVVRRT